MIYTVTNIYGINGESNHKTATAALRARDKREGDGWIVTSSDGSQIDRDWGSEARCV